MQYMRRTAGYTWKDYRTNTQIAKELKITPILDKLLEYKRNWIQHINRMPRNRLPRVMKRYCLTGRRNHGRPLKGLLDTWDRKGSESGPTPWQIYDDDDDDDDQTACNFYATDVTYKCKGRLHNTTWLVSLLLPAYWGYFPVRTAAIERGLPTVPPSSAQVKNESSNSFCPTDGFLSVDQDSSDTMRTPG